MPRFVSGSSFSGILSQGANALVLLSQSGSEHFVSDTRYFTDQAPGVLRKGKKAECCLGLWFRLLSVLLIDVYVSKWRLWVICIQFCCSASFRISLHEFSWGDLNVCSPWTGH